MGGKVSSPFDEATYKALLEGLEVSVLKLSEVLNDNKHFRFDDEYYQKDYLKLDKSISQKGFDYIFDCVNTITDFGAYSQMNFVNFQEEGILFLRNQDVKQNIVHNSNNIFISEDVYNKLTLKLQENDIVIPRVGTLGNAAVIKKELLPCTANQNLAILRNVNQDYNVYYLSTILSSNLGFKQINRASTGNVQQWLNLEGIGKLKIPKLSKEFQKLIETTVLKAHKTRQTSKNLYTTAEAELLAALGLSDYQPSTENVQVKSLKDSFLNSGRLDAEYFQPKDLEIIQTIENGDYGNLQEFVNISNGFPWKSKFFREDGQGEPVIRIRHCKPPFIDNSTISTLEQEYADSIDFEKGQTGDIVIGMDGLKYFYASQLIEPAYVNQRVAHLKVKGNLSSEYLTLVINSILGQTQLLREMTIAQTVGHLNNKAIMQTLIPIVDNTIHDEITQNIKTSTLLKTQSKQLLHIAKTGVEKAIESSKAEAMAWMEAEINSLNEAT